MSALFTGTIFDISRREVVFHFLYTYQHLERHKSRRHDYCYFQRRCYLATGAIRLTAVIQDLKALKLPFNVTIRHDRGIRLVQEAGNAVTGLAENRRSGNVMGSATRLVTINWGM